MKSELKTAEIYKKSQQNFAIYFLYKIENGRFPKPYNEVTSAKNVSVEHIMPQKLTEDWVNMLGDNANDIYNRYLNTLGNLSLSSRSKNSMMSNEPFRIKKEILKTQGSKFNVLNEDIYNYKDVFGEQEIEERCNRLSEIACSIYNLEIPDIQGIIFEDFCEVVCTTDYEDYYSSADSIAYKLFNYEFKTNSFSDILAGVATILLNKYPEKMRDLANQNFTPFGGDNTPCIHYSIGINDKDKLIGDNIRIYTKYRHGYCIQCAGLLMQQFNIEPDQLIIYLKKDSINTENILTKKNRIEIIRKSLEQLSNENKIIYNLNEMPKSNEYIKFQTEQLNLLFSFDGNTTWDKEKFKSISYLEYELSSNLIMITYKKIKESKKLTSQLRTFKNDLKILDENSNSQFWHLKKYSIDFKKINSASNKYDEMKRQIELILTQISSDLLDISTKLKL